MQIFYTPSINGNVIFLGEDESKHCIRVMRMTKGSMVNLVDGKGNLYKGIISKPDARGCEITVTEVFSDFEKRNYSLHIAISPVKNNDRFEWFIEKCVEIGIDFITPLICRNTEKTSVKTERINNIIISAMKQSVKAFKPLLNAPVTFTEFVKQEIHGTGLIAHCNQEIKRYSIDQVCRKGEDTTIMIGPEGDFSEEEIRMAIGNGYKPVHLGKSRLRTETAGIAACHSVYFINQ